MLRLVPTSPSSFLVSFVRHGNPEPWNQGKMAWSGHGGPGVQTTNKPMARTVR